MADRNIHPSTPKRLATAFLRAGSYQRLARELGVNVKYVYDLIAKGIEPKNPDVRVKLFLPRRARRERPLKPRTESKVPFLSRSIRKMYKVLYEAKVSS